MTYNACMLSFIETKLFSKLVAEYLSDEEYAKLQRCLAEDPQIGDLIPGSGGVRKLRWKGSGRGKRGGVRVIYFARIRQCQIWMLTLYAKNVSETISPQILKKIKEEIDG
jgi:hypothetical protein